MWKWRRFQILVSFGVNCCKISPKRFWDSRKEDGDYGGRIVSRCVIGGHAIRRVISYLLSVIVSLGEDESLINSGNNLGWYGTWEKKKGVGSVIRTERSKVKGSSDSQPGVFQVDWKLNSSRAAVRARFNVISLYRLLDVFGLG